MTTDALFVQTVLNFNPDMTDFWVVNLDANADVEIVFKDLITGKLVGLDYVAPGTLLVRSTFSRPARACRQLSAGGQRLGKRVVRLR